MKLKAKLPKDDANGVEEFNQELVGNLRNGKVVPAIVLLATEDVLARNSVAVAVIADIEGVPDEHREYVLELMGRIKADRLAGRQGATPLDLGGDDE